MLLLIMMIDGGRFLDCFPMDIVLTMESRAKSETCCCCCCRDVVLEMMMMITKGWSMLAAPEVVFVVVMEWMERNQEPWMTNRKNSIWKVPLKVFVFSFSYNHPHRFGDKCGSVTYVVLK